MRCYKQSRTRKPSPKHSAVELKPDCPQAHDSLGLAHLETCNREEALKELQAIQLLDAGFEGELSKRLASGK